MSIQKRKNGTLVTVAGLPNIDQILSADSRNAVENRTIYNALRLKVERTVNDLANYYLKSETYTKEEVEALIATISTMTMKIVTALPETDISTTTIYLIKSGATSYDEYIYVDGVWAKIGSTEINLEDYYTKEEVDELLDNLVTDVIIDVSVLPTSEIQNIIYRIVNEDNETEYYAGDADNQTTEQLAKKSDVTRTWTGTQAEWEQFESDYPEKAAKIEVRLITDDEGSSGLENRVEALETVGYYRLPTSALNADVVNTETNNIRIQTIGNLQICTGMLIFNAAGEKGNVTIFTLPTGYKPKYSAEGTALATGSSSVGCSSLRCWVEESGACKVWSNHADTQGYLFLTVIYAKA